MFRFNNLLQPFKVKRYHLLDHDTMLRYFVSQLDVRSQFITPLLEADDYKRNMLTAIRSKIADFFTSRTNNNTNLVDNAWCDAYSLERQLALIEPAETLLNEVRRRLDEADDDKVSCAPRLRSNYELISNNLIDATLPPPSIKAGGENILRAFLLDVLEETHWTFQRKFHSRPIQKSATRRLVWTGLVACALFISPYIYIYVRVWTGQNDYKLPIESWAWLPLWTATTAGFFGAMFSRLLFLQSNWGNLSLGALKDARDFSSIFLRGAVGMTGAIVVYYFLLSGVIGGGLFPNFQEIGLHQLSFKEAKSGEGSVALRLILPNSQLALLVVWSFLAGFSERIVPSLLQSTEISIGEAASKARSPAQKVP